MDFRHVDVFADRAYSGNGLIVFFGGVERASEELQAITAEMRQFESIFISESGDQGRVSARVFTVEEELDFAGHPIIGAAAAAHERWASDEIERSWTFLVGGPGDRGHEPPGGQLLQRQDESGTRGLRGSRSTTRRQRPSSRCLGLDPAARHDLPMQVVSTGLPYLIVPVTQAGLETARIGVDDFESHLVEVGAKFVYVFDPKAAKAARGTTPGTSRTSQPEAPRVLRPPTCGSTAWRSAPRFPCAKGAWSGRPSTMVVDIAENADIWIGGPVAPVASGALE